MPVVPELLTLTPASPVNTLQCPPGGKATPLTGPELVSGDFCTFTMFTVHHPTHNRLSTTSTAIMSTSGAPDVAAAATAPTGPLGEQIKTLIDALPTITTSNLDAHAKLLAALINVESPSEPRAWTLRLAILIIYHRAYTVAAWAASGALLLNRLAALISRDITDEALKDARAQPLRGPALVRKLVHGQLFGDFEQKEKRSVGCVALLGELYKLPPTSAVNVLGWTVYAAAKTIIIGEREEDGGDIEKLLMLLGDVKEKLAVETEGEVFMERLGEDLRVLAEDEGVPFEVQYQVAEMLESWES
ncbi:uncharacterized protein BDZ99DRAFT_514029 [Mytilinidion resinicola]|uniref:Uncharacterized protein n=1 Tax=Mytilinidion resinicola TaxID=574789 RepID=A0A6A6ZBX5_9PEZI|nr:uncharacterized protein BDZ99DRAFT_514029 [Mytilinidion resinicola]KAF2817815.1 hypothetical protein BDZ99DRAFT_514029 [Mytilinidion resinicola]